MSDAVADVGGEQLLLLAERGVWWEARRTLLIADPHFGKAAAFRSMGVPVPRGTTTGTLSRLDSMIARLTPERIVFLGDFLHAAEGRAAETLRVLNDWRHRHDSIEMVLVRGNHDARAGDPPRELEMRCVEPPVLETPFVFDHRARTADAGYVLCGHLHPGVRLSGAGRQSHRLPCFWFGPRIGVLPAFGEFTGLANVDVQADDRVWVVADDAVIRIPTANREPRNYNRGG